MRQVRARQDEVARPEALHAVPDEPGAGPFEHDEELVLGMEMPVWIEVRLAEVSYEQGVERGNGGFGDHVKRKAEFMNRPTPIQQRVKIMALNWPPARVYILIMRVTFVKIKVA